MRPSGPIRISTARERARQCVRQRTQCTTDSRPALHCAALRCAALHCTALHCTALHCTALHCTALHAVRHHVRAPFLPRSRIGQALVHCINSSSGPTAVVTVRCRWCSRGPSVLSTGAKALAKHCHRDSAVRLSRVPPRGIYAPPRYSHSICVPLFMNHHSGPITVAIRSVGRSWEPTASSRCAAVHISE